MCSVQQPWPVAELRACSGLTFSYESLVIKEFVHKEKDF